MLSGASLHFDSRAPETQLAASTFQEITGMNTQTLILTVLVLWLVMGLAFLSAYSEVKRTGGTLVDAMRNNETFFFIISIVVGLVVVAFKLA
jgi:hypothetical protein